MDRSCPPKNGNIGITAIYGYNTYFRTPKDVPLRAKYGPITPYGFVTGPLRVEYVHSTYKIRIWRIVPKVNINQHKINEKVAFQGKNARKDPVYSSLQLRSSLHHALEFQLP